MSVKCFANDEWIFRVFFFMYTYCHNWLSNNIFEFYRLNVGTLTVRFELFMWIGSC